jgi:hypothetical protein
MSQTANQWGLFQILLPESGSWAGLGEPCTYLARPVPFEVLVAHVVLPSARARVHFRIISLFILVYYTIKIYIYTTNKYIYIHTYYNLIYMCIV